MDQLRGGCHVVYTSYDSGQAHLMLPPPPEPESAKGGAHGKPKPQHSKYQKKDVPRPT
jgi:hypothetical protein